MGLGKWCGKSDLVVIYVRGTERRNSRAASTEHHGDGPCPLGNGDFHSVLGQAWCWEGWFDWEELGSVQGKSLWKHVRVTGGCPWGQAGWSVLGSGVLQLQLPSRQEHLWWDMPGSCLTERGMDPWCRVWALAAFVKVFKDKSAVTSLCPWGLSSSGPEQSLCCPVIPAGRRQRRQAPGLVPYSHRARRHWEPILSTMRSFFHRAGGAGSDVRRGRAPAAAQGSRQRAQLRSAPLQLCRGLGTGEPNRCLHLHR